MYDAVSKVWNAFEIKLYDTPINFNDLKLLDFGEIFIVKKNKTFYLLCTASKLIQSLGGILMLIIIISYIHSAW